MQLHTLMKTMLPHTEVIVKKGFESTMSGNAEMILDSYEHLGYNVISIVDMGHYIEIEVSSRKNNIKEEKVILHDLIKLARTSGKPSRFEIVDEDLKQHAIGLTSPLIASWYNEEEFDFTSYQDKNVLAMVIDDNGVSIMLEGLDA